MGHRCTDNPYVGSDKKEIRVLICNYHERLYIRFLVKMKYFKTEQEESTKLDLRNNQLKMEKKWSPKKSDKKQTWTVAYLGPLNSG